MFPQTKGTYILILYSGESVSLTIGKSGRFDLPAGWYTYVGSALGPGGLRSRLKHHLSPVRKAHWHIDYLRTVATVETVWYLADETRYEHHWANILQSLSHTSTPVPGFGASDCRCETHLIYFPLEPAFDELSEKLSKSLQRWHRQSRT